MNQLRAMIIGDVATVGIVTVAGFATHDELSSTFLIRMFVLFGALSLSWLASAGAIGALDRVAQNGRFTWRVPVAMLIAAPVAALLRALVLWVPVVPVFVIVITAVAMTAISVWRILWSRLATRFQPASSSNLS